MNRPVTLAVVGALSVGGFFTVSRTTRTRPGITFSNRLFADKSGRVVKSTLVPKPTWRGGQTWVVTIAHAAPFGTETLTVRQPASGTYTFTDSIFQPFPSCVPYRVTVRPDTVLTATGRVSTRRDSLTAKRSLCRPYTRVEIAEQDSFPPSSYKIVVCGKQYAPVDTANGWGPPWRDSLPVTFRNDTAQTRVGYSVRLGLTRKHRYTGRVELYDGDDFIACESARKSRESERAS